MWVALLWRVLSYNGINCAWKNWIVSIMILMHILYSFAVLYQYLFLGRVETRGSWLIKLCFKVRLRWITLSSQCAIYLIVTCLGGRDLSWGRYSWRTLREGRFDPCGLLSGPARCGRCLFYPGAWCIAGSAGCHCAISGLHTRIRAARLLVSCHWGKWLLFICFMY